MGEAIPPTFEAKAIPKINALMNWEPLGKVRVSGVIKLKHMTGAATFSRNADAINATPIMVSNTTDGLVPAFDKIHVDINLAMWYLDNAAAKVNPPNNNKITEFHMVLKINLDAST